MKPNIDTSNNEDTEHYWTEEEVDESKMTAGEIMREYTNKVTASMGDNGANTKSTVAGANDMGGDAGNIAQGAEEKGMTPAKPTEDNAGNRNVPGGTSAKSGTKNEPGHGAEKKSKPESADNKKATIGS